MIHPFEGIMDAGLSGSLATRGGRRSFLAKTFGLVGAAVAGLFGLSTTASAQIYTTQALGEEGGRGGYYPPPPPPPWQRYPSSRWRYRRPRYTTYALGEEGGPYTTQALGEEGGYYVPR